MLRVLGLVALIGGSFVTAGVIGAAIAQPSAYNGAPLVAWLIGWLVVAAVALMADAGKHPAASTRRKVLWILGLAGLIAGSFLAVVPMGTAAQPSAYNGAPLVAWLIGWLVLGVLALLAASGNARRRRQAALALSPEQRTPRQHLWAEEEAARAARQQERAREKEARREQQAAARGCARAGAGP